MIVFNPSFPPFNLTKTIILSESSDVVFKELRLGPPIKVFGSAAPSAEMTNEDFKKSRLFMIIEIQVV